MNHSFEAFRKAANQNPVLQKEIESVVESKGIDYDAISEFGKKHNYTFTAAEAMQLMASNDELSDFELEMVAAGNATNCSGQAQGNA